MQWVRAQLPIWNQIYIMTSALGYLVCWTHLSDVSCTCVNKLLPPAIDPEDSSLERIVESMDEVYQRLRGFHSWGAPQDL